MALAEGALVELVSGFERNPKCTAECSIYGRIFEERKWVEDPNVPLYYFHCMMTSKRTPDGCTHQTSKEAISPWNGWYEQDCLARIPPAVLDTFLRRARPDEIPHSSGEPRGFSFWELCYLCYAMLPRVYAPFDLLYHVPVPSVKTDGVASVYVCHRCMMPFFRERDLEEHLALYCLVRKIPGDVIYQRNEDDVGEGGAGRPSRAQRSVRVNFVDGAKHMMYCRCLAMVGRCFVESKDLKNDVDIYEFFVVSMTPGLLRSPNSSAPIGAVAKEMEQYDAQQWDGFFVVAYFARIKHQPEHTLSALTTLPPFRRMGLGFLMLDIAYYCCRIRQATCGCGRFCGADGRSGYISRPYSGDGAALLYSYWYKAFADVMETVLLFNVEESDTPNGNDANHSGGRMYSVEEICRLTTKMHESDLVYFLKEQKHLFYAPTDDSSARGIRDDRIGAIFFDAGHFKQIQAQRLQREALLGTSLLSFSAAFMKIRPSGRPVYDKFHYV